MAMRAPRSSRRGLTLIELMIGVAIALFLTAAAVTFVRHETRLMGISQDRIDMIQGSRAAIDLINDDLRAAGQGIGYTEAGSFGGLLRGTFVAGTQTFNPNGANEPNPAASPPGPGAFRTIMLNDSTNGSPVGQPWSSNVVDIGVVYAAGAYRTIANFENTTLEYCARDDDGDGVGDQGFQNGEALIMREGPGIAAQTVTLAGISGPSACGKDLCLLGCFSANWAPAATQLFSSGPAAAVVTYFAGELAGGIRQVVWFVVPSGNGYGQLQRVQFDAANPSCPAIDGNCGGTVAGGVESLQMQVWQWDRPTSTWINTGQGPIDDAERLRVDVELVVRAEGADDRQHDIIPLKLRNGACVPEPCVRAPDYTERRAYRTSIEIKNSGYMRMR
jgi:prepilin-type N-terminal cleavage/methylation domain-containing protein